MQGSAPGTGRRSRIQALTLTALMTAVTCVLAPFSLSIGPVPISLTNLVIFFSVYLLGWKRAAMSTAAYLLIGLIGLPVFSGFAGGPGKLLGPTGGYLIGFVPMAVIAGLLLSRTERRALQFLAMAAGMAVCYTFGTAWFCAVMDATAAAALGACVLPFVLPDLFKGWCALALAAALERRRVRL